MSLEQLVSVNLFQFFLVFARLGSAIMLLPGFGEAYVPPRVRLIFALTVSFALMPMIANSLPAMPAAMSEFAALLVMEIGIGLFFGMLARIILLGVQSACSRRQYDRDERRGADRDGSREPGALHLSDACELGGGSRGSRFGAACKCANTATAHRCWR